MATEETAVLFFEGRNGFPVARQGNLRSGKIILPRRGGPAVRPGEAWMVSLEDKGKFFSAFPREKLDHVVTWSIRSPNPRWNESLIKVEGHHLFAGDSSRSGIHSDGRLFLGDSSVAVLFRRRCGQCQVRIVRGGAEEVVEFREQPGERAGEDIQEAETYLHKNWGYKPQTPLHSCGLLMEYEVKSLLCRKCQQRVSLSERQELGLDPLPLSIGGGFLNIAEYLGV